MIRSFRRNVSTGSVLLTSAWALNLGCGLPADGAAPGSDALPVEPPGKTSAALTRAVSCEAVLSRIQSATITRLLARAEELRVPPPAYSGELGVVIDTPLLAAPEAVGVASGESRGAADADSSGAASGFSGTTVQVE